MSKLITRLAIIVGHTEYNVMHELNMNEISEVNGGASLFALGTLVTILITASEGLNDLGKGIGEGLYDATH